MQKKSMFSQEIPVENFGIATEELHWEKVDEGGNFSSEFVESVPRKWYTERYDGR